MANWPALAPLIARAGRPLVIVDIALPRDIDPDAGSISHVDLIDLDGLNARLEHSLSERMAQVPHVQAILDEELSAFSAYLESLDVIPLIAGIHQRAEDIRQAEVDKTLRRLPGLSGAEIERIEAMTHALVRKLLETPTHRLREQGAHRSGPEFTTVARQLFGLEPTDGAIETVNAAD
jgi:glutamyl-tRNA reductase